MLETNKLILFIHLTFEHGILKKKKKKKKKKRKKKKRKKSIAPTEFEEWVLECNFFEDLDHLSIFIDNPSMLLY